ncbi:hypothetical protein BY458DRAFT_556667 [Sporodiniella umbellata]|nr:hypothetical protein BY458DRAFT_556667 [Sporodiniella umbellata]
MNDENELVSALIYNKKTDGLTDCLIKASLLGKEASPEFIISLTEVLCTQIKTMAQDLEAFAK